MEKINNIINYNKEIETKLKQNYIKALENETFNSYIKRLNINSDLLMKYTSSLKESCIEFQNCISCQNLDNCPNKIKGYIYKPFQENKRIIFEYIICPKAKKQLYKDNIELFDIPSNIRNASLSDVYKDKNRLELIKEIKQYISNYENNIKCKAIYLHGSFGTGKTYLIAALFNELAKKNVKGIVIHVPELLRSLKDSFDTDYTQKYNNLKTVPLLLLDDIGAEHLTSWARDEVLEPILQYRMDENLPTFFTSNFTLEELEKHLCTTQNSIDKVKARRIIERITQLSTPIELVSKNYRNN